MQQAWHIFKKDVRQFRYLIFLLIIWNTAPVLESARGWPQGPGAALRPGFWISLQLGAYLLPVLWAYAIALVVHADALPGDRQFWLTRPYGRFSLLAAKALFVVAFMSLPLLVTQAAMVWMAGLPLRANLAGLTWEQVVVAVTILLPALALAALTRSLVQFIVAAFVLSAPLLWPIAYVFFPPGALSWIRVTAGVSVAALCAAGVLAFQYARRRTRTARFVASAGACAALCASLLPWRLVAAVQSQFLPPLPAASATLTAPERRIVVRPPSPARGISLAFDFHGLQNDDKLSCEATAIDIETASGPRWHSQHEITGATGPWIVNRTCGLGAAVPAGVLDAAAQGPVHLRAQIYATVFGTAEPTAVPLDAGPTDVQGIGVCWSTRGSASGETIVNCRTAFRRPRVLTEPHATAQPLGFAFTYAPFPAELRIQPIEQLTYHFFQGETPVITTRAPIAHLRLDVDEANVRLVDYEFGD